MKNKMTKQIALIALFTASLTAQAKELSKNPEVAEFQKLEKMVRKQVETGVASREQSLKAAILENRARYANKERTEKEWLAKEQQLNTSLLKMQTARVSAGENAIDAVFTFQNGLLSTRELLKQDK